MKARFIGMVVMMAVCVSCAMQRLTPAEKEARQQQMAQMVADSLEDAHFRVVFDYVIPTRMQPRHLTTPYEVRVKGDTLNSHLPYFGVVYAVPYGGGEGLIFDAHIDGYQCQKVKSDMYRVVVYMNRPEDNYVYTFDIFDNGRADLKVSCRNRDFISYRGQMDVKLK